MSKIKLNSQVNHKIYGACKVVNIIQPDKENGKVGYLLEIETKEGLERFNKDRDISPFKSKIILKRCFEDRQNYIN